MTNKIALIVGPGHAGLGEALANRYGQKGVYDCPSRPKSQSVK